MIDLQGLDQVGPIVAKLARGTRFAPGQPDRGLQLRGAGSLAGGSAIRVEPHIHAMDRSRVLVAALGRDRPAKYGLNGQRVFAHRQPDGGSVRARHSRDDKLWPVEHWAQLGKRVIGAAGASACRRATSWR